MPDVTKEQWKRLLHSLDEARPPHDMGLYVEPARSSASAIVEEVESEPMAHRKFLLVGARGGGKSTELREVARRLAEDTTLVTVDLRATGVNLGLVSAFDLLYVAGVALLGKLPDKGEHAARRGPLFDALATAYGRDKAGKLGDVDAAIGGVVSFAQATALAAAALGLPRRRSGRARSGRRRRSRGPAPAEQGSHRRSCLA